MEKTYTLTQAHTYFGVEFNNAIFPLLEKENRTKEEDLRLLNLAHAAMLHWQNNPKHTIVNMQRAQYMLACAYTFTQHKDMALMYARLCFETTQNNLSEMQDFDVAYAHLALARALALNGDNRAKEVKQKALELGNNLSNEGDKKYFLADIKIGPWFGG